MKGLRDRLRDNEVVVFDGGVGTYLYEKGIFINTCFDELNVTNPDLVAGGAPRLRGGRRGRRRDEHVRRQPVQARAARPREARPRDQPAWRGDRQGRGEGHARWSPGSIGPLGVEIEPLGKLSYDEARDAFKEQARGPGRRRRRPHRPRDVRAGERAASRPSRRCGSSTPDAADRRAGHDQRRGQPAQRGDARELRRGRSPRPAWTPWGSTARSGPRAMLDALETLKTLTALPISVQPNAGLPQNIGGPQHLHDVARVHGGVRQAVHPDRARRSSAGAAARTPSTSGRSAGPCARCSPVQAHGRARRATSR